MSPLAWCQEQQRQAVHRCEIEIAEANAEIASGRDGDPSTVDGRNVIRGLAMWKADWELERALLLAELREGCA